MFIDKVLLRTEGQLMEYLEQEVSDFPELWDKIIAIWKASYGLPEFYMD